MTATDAPPTPAPMDVGTLTRAERQRFAEDAARAHDPERLWPLLEAFLARRAKSGALTSRHTYASYRTGLRTFLERARHWDLLDADLDDAQDLVNLMLRDGYSIATVSARVAAANNLYKALRWAKATQNNPFDGVVVPKDGRHALEKRPPYEEAYLQRVASVIQERLQHPAHPKRARALEAWALLILLWHAGLRIDEALSLTWTDVHLDVTDPYVIVASGKGRKSRSVPLSERLAQALRVYRSVPRRKSQGLDFVLGVRTWRGACKLLEPFFQEASDRQKQERVLNGEPPGNVEAFRGFHAIRKRFGTKLYEELGDFVAVAEILGHADVQTTRSYVRVSEKRARKAMQNW